MSAAAQSVDSTMWVTGDRVLAIAPAGDTVYVGGIFNYVGVPTGRGVPLDARTAEPLEPFPRIVGEVRTVVADGDGGWFVGGMFTHVGPEPRRNLVHILSDGSIATWAPDPDSTVWSLALSGQTLYLGGDFDSVGGHRAPRLAAIDSRDDSKPSWIGEADGRVSALLPLGGRLYVGGWFNSIAGEPRTYLAALDSASGALAPWQVTLDNRVTALAASDTTIIVGGYFRTVAGESRTALVAVGVRSGALLPWDPQLSRTPITSQDGGPHVRALCVSGDSLFVGGSFSRLGGQARRGLALLDLATASARPWDARATRPVVFGPEIWSIIHVGDTVFVAGAFDSLGGESRAAGLEAAALDSHTARRLEWNANPNDFVLTIAYQRGAIYAGGRFTSLADRWVRRFGLASFDNRTGRVTDWDPRPDSYIKSLRYHAGVVYAGGYFDSVGGQRRNGLAALDPVTGKATSWDPNPNASVWSIEPLGPNIVVAGRFTSIGGQPRVGIAMLDSVSGLATSWDARMYGEGYSVAVTDSAVYVGGLVTSVAGEPRSGLAALDSQTGAPLSFAPVIDGDVEAILARDGVIYVGSLFSSVNGVPRTHVAAIDVDGTLRDWSPQIAGPPSPSVRVHSLAMSDSTVILGGSFTEVNGEPRPYFAAVDATTGALRTSYPTVDGIVWAVASEPGSVYLGGNFERVGSWPQAGFAAIRELRPNKPPDPVDPHDTFAVVASPNPASASTTIRYALPGPMDVSLSVFDLQGRVLSTPLRQVRQPAGPQAVTIATAGLRPGCYLYQLRFGRRSETRRFVVIR